MNSRKSLLVTISVLLGIVLLFSGCFAPPPNTPSSTDVISYAGDVDSNESSHLSESSDLLPSSSTEESSTVVSSNKENTGSSFTFSFGEIPEYQNKPFTYLNNNTPIFSKTELSQIGEEHYAALDSLKRCGIAFAICGTEIMPKNGEKRGSISHIYPSGWKQAQYDSVNGKYLYNRCHLLGWQLSAENDNPRNLITGTRYMNIEGMLPFENMIADYIKETGNHVAYRVTPRFKNNELVARGVELEAYSIEDQGDGICFHVYVYNVQPNVTISYADGSSKQTLSNATSSKVTSYVVSSSPKVSNVSSSTSQNIVYITPTGKRYHLISTCGGKNSYSTTLEQAKSKGLTPCKKCAS